jgi:hypothetical protein
VREHAPELEVLDHLADGHDIGLDGLERRVVAFAAGEVEELARIGKAGIDLLERAAGFLERAALLAEVLRALRIVPDLRVFEGLGDFYEACALVVVVKDTSAARPNAARGPGGSCR